MPDTTTDNTETAPEGDASIATPKDVHQADTPEGVPSGTPEGPDSESDPDDAGLSRRDIKYRERLRETEAERDQLRATVESMRRREVERLAAEHLTKPAALWTVGVELSTLIGEDGTVDPEAVLIAAQDAKQQLGLEDPKAKLRGSPVVPREGTSTKSGGKSGSWSDAFKR